MNLLPKIKTKIGTGMATSILLTGLISCRPTAPENTSQKSPLPMNSQNQSTVPEILPQAQAGDATAQFRLAQLYDSADNKVSLEAGKEALFWYEKAAAQNYPKAAEHAGYVILNGLAGEADHARALKWLVPAAENGSEWASFMIATSYLRGQGVPSDLEKAFPWFERAAAQGSAEAHFRLGYAFYRGAGTIRDNAKAVEWFQKGAKMGNSSARACLGAMAWGGVGMPRDYAVAKAWFEEAMESKGGNTWAPFMLGVMSENGQGVPRDLKKAEGYYRQAAAGGHYSAKIRAALFPLPSGSKALPLEPLHYLIRDAEKGNPLAQFVLGLARKQGYGGEPAPEEALVWLELAAVPEMPSAKEEAVDLRAKLSKKSLAQADERIKKLRESYAKEEVFLF